MPITLKKKIDVQFAQVLVKGPNEQILCLLNVF
jgi:hypothetical protein